MPKVQHLNFCRQAIAQLKAQLSGEIRQGMRDCLIGWIIALTLSQKFLLPFGGGDELSKSDASFRGIGSDSLWLPYPIVALEWMRSRVEPGENELTSTRVIAVAIDGDADTQVFRAGAYAGSIAVLPLPWIDELRKWWPFPPIALSKKSAIIRGPSASEVEVHMRTVVGAEEAMGSCAPEVDAVLHFISMLSCSNVHVEKSYPKRAARKNKEALPLDEYHVLTIAPLSGGARGEGRGGTHRSPREHLRRGHIRRLPNKRVWVNATVVAAGNRGAIRKDYRIQDHA